ncbi:hypothetical protein M9Y10_007632 [Tritrichomonas musculus]|uniref:Uncharacterized protein n=1 Tax=Tritrichomonas musculus TaxID=1915356 RepID=A0ABR2J1W5_9EUKA
MSRVSSSLSITSLSKQQTKAIATGGNTGKAKILMQLIEQLKKERNEYEKTNQHLMQNTRLICEENQKIRDEIINRKAYYENMLDRCSKSTKTLETEFDRSKKVSKIYHFYKKQAGNPQPTNTESCLITEEMKRYDQEISDTEKSATQLISKFSESEKNLYYYQILLSLNSRLTNINRLFEKEAQNCISTNDSNPQLFKRSRLNRLRQKIGQGDEIKRELSLLDEDAEDEKLASTKKALNDISINFDRCLSIYNEILLISKKRTMIDELDFDDTSYEGSSRSSSRASQKPSSKLSRKKPIEITLDEKVVSSVPKSFSLEDEVDELRRIVGNEGFGYLNGSEREEQYRRMQSLFVPGKFTAYGYDESTDSEKENSQKEDNHSEQQNSDDHQEEETHHVDDNQEEEEDAQEVGDHQEEEDMQQANDCQEEEEMQQAEDCQEEEESRENDGQPAANELEHQEDEDACKGDKSPQQGSASKAGKSRKKHKKKLIKIRRQKVSKQDVAVQAFNSMKSVPITKPKQTKKDDTVQPPQPDTKQAEVNKPVSISILEKLEQKSEQESDQKAGIDNIEKQNLTESDKEKKNILESNSEKHASASALQPLLGDPTKDEETKPFKRTIGNEVITEFLLDESKEESDKANMSESDKANFLDFSTDSYNLEESATSVAYEVGYDSQPRQHNRTLGNVITSEFQLEDLEEDSDAADTEAEQMNQEDVNQESEHECPKQAPDASRSLLVHPIRSRPNNDSKSYLKNVEEEATASEYQLNGYEGLSEKASTSNQILVSDHSQKVSDQKKKESLSLLVHPPKDCPRPDPKRSLKSAEHCTTASEYQLNEFDALSDKISNSNQVLISDHSQKVDTSKSEHSEKVQQNRVSFSILMNQPKISKLSGSRQSKDESDEDALSDCILTETDESEAPVKTQKFFLNNQPELCTDTESELSEKDDVSDISEYVSNETDDESDYPIRTKKFFLQPPPELSSETESEQPQMSDSFKTSVSRLIHSQKDQEQETPGVEKKLMTGGLLLDLEDVSEPEEAPQSNNFGIAAKPAETPKPKLPVQQKPKPEELPRAKLTGQQKPTETPKPKPTETSKSKPAETSKSKPTEAPKPKPIETPKSKPAEVSKPKPAETPKPKLPEQPKPKPEELPRAKPTEQPKQVEQAKSKPVRKPKPNSDDQPRQNLEELAKASQQAVQEAIALLLADKKRSSVNSGKRQIPEHLLLDLEEDPTPTKPRKIELFTKPKPKPAEQPIPQPAEQAQPAEEKKPELPKAETKTSDNKRTSFNLPIHPPKAKKQPRKSTYDPSIFCTPMNDLYGLYDDDLMNDKEKVPITVTLKDIELEGLDSSTPDKAIINRRLVKQKRSDEQRSHSQKGSRNEPKLEANGNSEVVCRFNAFTAPSTARRDKQASPRSKSGLSDVNSNPKKESLLDKAQKAHKCQAVKPKTIQKSKPKYRTNAGKKGNKKDESKQEDKSAKKFYNDMTNKLPSVLMLSNLCCLSE